jgi:hypothetical protein
MYLQRAVSSARSVCTPLAASKFRRFNHFARNPNSHSKRTFRQKPPRRLSPLQRLHNVSRRFLHFHADRTSISHALNHLPKISTVSPTPPRYPRVRRPMPARYTHPEWRPAHPPSTLPIPPRFCPKSRESPQFGNAPQLPPMSANQPHSNDLPPIQAAHNWDRTRKVRVGGSPFARDCCRSWPKLLEPLSLNPAVCWHGIFRRSALHQCLSAPDRSPT